MSPITVVRNLVSQLRALLALGLLLAAAPRLVHAQEGGIAVGASAPGAAVTTLEGAPVDLSSYIGQTPVVLEFWATWCPLCRQLEPALSAARKKYTGRVTFIAVGVPNNQSAERQKAYAAAHDIGGVLVFDRDGRAVKAYAAPHTSYVVAIDKAGTVVYTGVGGAQDIEAVVGRALPAMDAMHSGAPR
jgi:thiol-disulfide isomerase/thioredoxin